VTLFDNGADGSDALTPYGSDDTVSDTCPTDMDLLMLMLDDRGTPSDPMVEHVRSCNSCRPRVTGLRHVLCEIAARIVDSDSAEKQCLQETALIQLADGGGATREQITHLAGCAHCRRELASLADLLTDPQIKEEIRRVEPTRTSRPSARRRFAFDAGRVVALAAAAAVLFMVWSHGERLSRPTERSMGANAGPHRAPTITASEAPVPMSPVGDVDGRPAFSWSSVLGSDRYRLTLYDNAGRVMYEAHVLDTTLTIPDSLVTVPGRSYLWQVEARNGVDRWTPSELVEFRIVPRRGR
jgi:hypothetical protein